MRILVIGDFHGKFPSKLKERLSRESFDVIVSTGDFCHNKELERLFFRYAYGTDIGLGEFIGKRKNNELERKNLLAGFKVLKVLNSLGRPVMAVTGNWDPVDYEEVGLPKMKDANSKNFKAFVKKMKCIKMIDFESTNYSGVNFVGYPRSTYPGKPSLRIQKRLKDNAKEVLDKINADNKRYFNIFKGLVSKDTVFISHNSPYRTKLDIIGKGSQKGRHYGSYLVKKIITELKPRLVLCGHMHENQGVQKIGRTLVVNIGAAYEGKAALIDYKKRIDVKLIR
jgi:Icc-related predicted phosphoesterase